ncbi:TlpA disulfide reductase family protein [Methylobacterium sp. 17Sr1-1]|uniref:peroxiredoxin family protein n=1 Tax=Methylobacterium sp. 17Sr1-1 TaxID=2202826 RepID=UPI000D6F946C|nr:TlpA disulfide reductase family protein [Methylobacterium sp. 17Sr1-1]AWN51059.1 alkyl hydroperoxide reductase [Methylobacterium sp. 17Sr1-1]
MPALAPELEVSRWFNAPTPLTLADLRGKVVVLHAFQMLCPGCVAHGTLQAEKLHRLVARGGDVVVIGLHTVFEHHAAMTEVALDAFIHEYQLTFPIGVDRPSEDDPIPRTMRRYGMRGTPSTIVIDRDGVVREHAFGQVDDLTLGVLLGSLIAASSSAWTGQAEAASGCDNAGCPLPAVAST